MPRLLTYGAFSVALVTWENTGYRGGDSYEYKYRFVGGGITPCTYVYPAATRNKRCSRLSIDLAEAQPRRRGAANVGKRRHLRCRKGKKSVRILPVDAAAKRARARVRLLLDPIEYARILRRAALDGATLDRLAGGGGHTGLGCRYQPRQLQQARAAPQQHTAGQLIQQQRASRTSLIK